MSMFKNKILWFTLVLGLTLSGEGMITISLTWSVLKQQGSIVHLGIVLSLMSIVPFALQRYIKVLNESLRNKPLQTFAVVRFLGIISIFCLIIFFKEPNLTTLYIFASIFSIIIFISMQSIETFMSLLVLNKRIDSHKASSLLQTAIQAGALIGNSLGGIILTIYNFFGVMIALLICFSFGLLIPILTKPINNLNEFIAYSKKSEESFHIKSESKNLKQKEIVLLFLLLISIGILTIQLATFNFTLPIIFYDLRSWEASLYGIVSAMAGLGALSASIIVKKIKVLDYVFIIIFFSNVILSFVSDWKLILFIAFLLGFSLNSTRIMLRRQMFDLIKSPIQANVWSGRITAVTQFTKSFSPLILSIIIMFLGRNSAPYVFSSIGFIVVTIVLLNNVYKYKMRYELVNRDKDSFF